MSLPLRQYWPSKTTLSIWNEACLLAISFTREDLRFGGPFQPPTSSFLARKVAKKKFDQNDYGDLGRKRIDDFEN